MTYAFARVGAVVAMRVEDYFANGKRWWVRLHEKGGKQHEMPAHHKLEAFIDEYMEAAGIGDALKSPLFRAAMGRAGTLSLRGMNRIDDYRMVQRRALKAGLPVLIECHTFRATGITAYLEAGGSLENAQAMAAHESTRTTKLYGRTGDEITLRRSSGYGFETATTCRRAASYRTAFAARLPLRKMGDLGGCGYRAVFPGLRSGLSDSHDNKDLVEGTFLTGGMGA